MHKEEFEKIPRIEKDKLASHFKIKSYKKKLSFMSENHIPQKDINEVLNHLFFSSNIISEKTKTSVSKIIYYAIDSCRYQPYAYQHSGCLPIRVHRYGPVIISD